MTQLFRLSSDHELNMNDNNWPRYLMMTSAREKRPLSKLSPFAVQKGFQAIAGTLKKYQEIDWCLSSSGMWSKGTANKPFENCGVYRLSRESFRQEVVELVSRSHLMQGSSDVSTWGICLNWRLDNKMCQLCKRETRWRVWWAPNLLKLQWSSICCS